MNQSSKLSNVCFQEFNRFFQENIHALNHLNGADFWALISLSPLIF